jgi:hypothetical protein
MSRLPQLEAAMFETREAHCQTQLSYRIGEKLKSTGGDTLIMDMEYGPLEAITLALKCQLLILTIALQNLFSQRHAKVVCS